jgi:hypothetical protein
MQFITKVKNKYQILGTGSDLNDSDISVVVDFAKKYNKLGNAIQEQFDELMDSNYEDLNPNAVKEMKVLARYHEDIKTALDAYATFMKDNNDD